MTSLRLLVLDDYEGVLSAAPAMDRLRQNAEVTILDRPLTAADDKLLAESDVLFALRERTRMDAGFFERCHRVELVLQSGGHAYHLDKEAASSRGIVVALGRRVTQPMVVVPELAFGLMLGLVRQLYPLHESMRQGAWTETVVGSSLAGRTLGILGYGRHGQPIARLAEAFGMRVIAWDRTGNAQHKGEPEIDAFGVARMDLDSLLAQSDIVSIHLRLSDESRGLMNADRLAKMKPGALLINTARGAIVDESALIDALRQGRIAGAGLDVFANEPLSPDSPLRTLPNVLLTPHAGWKVREVLHEFTAIAADQLDAWLAGALPEKEVLNPEAMRIERPRHGAISARTG